MRRFSTLQTLSFNIKKSANQYYLLSKEARVNSVVNKQKTLTPKNGTIDFLLNFSKNLVIDSSDNIGNVEFYLG